jgi:hypothetical protein
MNAFSASGRKIAKPAALVVPPLVKCPQIQDGDRCRNTQELVSMIHYRWLCAGWDVPVWVEEDGSIHSDTVNGLPVAKILPFEVK